MVRQQVASHFYYIYFYFLGVPAHFVRRRAFRLTSLLRREERSPIPNALHFVTHSGAKPRVTRLTGCDAKSSTRASARKPYARRRIFLSSHMQGGFISIFEWDFIN